MQSQTSPAKKFSIAAAEAFLSELKAKGITVAEKTYRDLASIEAPLAAVKEHWARHFETGGLPKDTAQALLQALDKCAADHPHPSAIDVAEGKLTDDVVFVKNMARFKAELTMSKAATPVKIYSDLDARL